VGGGRFIAEPFSKLTTTRTVGRSSRPVKWSSPGGRSYWQIDYVVHLYTGNLITQPRTNPHGANESRHVKGKWKL